MLVSKVVDSRAQVGPSMVPMVFGAPGGDLQIGGLAWVVERVGREGQGVRLEVAMGRVTFPVWWPLTPRLLAFLTLVDGEASMATILARLGEQGVEVEGLEGEVGQFYTRAQDTDLFLLRGAGVEGLEGSTRARGVFTLRFPRPRLRSPTRGLQVPPLLLLLQLSSTPPSLSSTPPPLPSDTSSRCQIYWTRYPAR